MSSRLFFSLFAFVCFVFSPTDNAARRHRECVLSLLKFRRGMNSHKRSRFREKEHRRNPHSFVSLSLSGEQKKKKKKRPPLLFSRTNFSLSLSLFLFFPPRRRRARSLRPKREEEEKHDDTHFQQTFHAATATGRHIPACGAIEEERASDSTGVGCA